MRALSTLLLSNPGELTPIVFTRGLASGFNSGMIGSGLPVSITNKYQIGTGILAMKTIETSYLYVLLAEIIDSG